MCYIPLFLSLHDNIVDNPLDMSDQKYTQPPRTRPPSSQRDMNPLGFPLNKKSSLLMRKQARDLMEGRLNAAGFRPETRDRLQRFGRYSPTSFGFDCDYRNYDWLLVLSLLLLLEITICLGFVFKIQDYFIILSEKLKHGWTLTTSQYTITRIVYFKTQRTVTENTTFT